MIINKDFYRCMKCDKRYSFDTSKEYSKLCPGCGEEMEFWLNSDCDTELAEQRKNQTPIIPSSKPTITCPTCQSTNVRKMYSIERGASIAMFGIFSKKINKTFKCDNCGMTF